MAKYTVVNSFHDTTDKEKLYLVGQSFPQPANKKIPAKRIKQLLAENMIEKAK